MSTFHKSVLLQEAVLALNVLPGKKYIDATFGGGGHSFEILKRGGIVLGIDIDQEAIEHVKKILRDKDIRILRGNFKNIAEIANSEGFGHVSGILLDLGVSSHQLEEEEGFSFQRDEPLDMRFSKSESSVTAGDLVNGLTKKELYELFNKLAEEKYSWAIANSIISARKVRPIRKTGELADIIVKTYMKLKIKRGKIHPATKIFQALRIAVNSELENLKEALPRALELLDFHGRLVVISFHSLEDRIVKEFGKLQEEKGKIVMLTEKPIMPTFFEVSDNPRARSAKMRVYER